MLKYHGLTKAYDSKDLAGNNTFETALESKDGSLGGLNQRVRVEKSLVPPCKCGTPSLLPRDVRDGGQKVHVHAADSVTALKLNFYAQILVTDKKASNGYFHTLKYALLPPASLFDEYYLFPEAFATLTSAVQRLHATHYYSWEFDPKESKRDHPVFHGVGLATNFAPDNLAFGKLPEGLKRFLFSPFGGRVLAKILMYHYVPHTLLLSELLHTEKHHGHHDKLEFTVLEDGDKEFKKEIDVPTALPNATLHVTVDKSKVPVLDGQLALPSSTYFFYLVSDAHRRLQDSCQGQRPLRQGL